MVPTPNGGERVLWEDGVTQDEDRVYSVEEAHKRVAQHYEIGKIARGVTVSTPFLADLYKAQGIEQVYVFPNSVREQDYFFPNLAPHDGIRILWQGGTSHFEDWMPCAGAMAEVLKENPQAKLVVWGAIFPWMKKLPAEQLEFHPWDDYAAYKIKRPCMDADINLCPLVDSPFNRGKSAIKWYEGSIGPRPEATLAANVGPYKEIEHGVTGLLYNNPQEFKEQLTALIRNKELRKTLGNRARQWVLANRDANKTVVGLFEFYHELKRLQRMEALAV
jgi:glycosyltransferase involved in cell wall biosynthesis